MTSISYVQFGGVTHLKKKVYDNDVVSHRFKLDDRVTEDLATLQSTHPEMLIGSSKDELIVELDPETELMMMSSDKDEDVKVPFMKKRDDGVFPHFHVAANCIKSIPIQADKRQFSHFYMSYLIGKDIDTLVKNV